MKQLLLAFALSLATPSIALACDCQKKEAAKAACDCPGQSCPGTCPGMESESSKPKPDKKPEKQKRSARAS